MINSTLPVRALRDALRREISRYMRRLLAVVAFFAGDLAPATIVVAHATLVGHLSTTGSLALRSTRLVRRNYRVDVTRPTTFAGMGKNPESDMFG